MKVLYVVLLAIFLSFNVIAEDSFSDNLDKQSCSQNKSLVENSSVFIPKAQYMVAGTCGFKPFKPWNCSKGRAVCYCDERGQNCSWVWIGCG
jgi:hypothetical protein